MKKLWLTVLLLATLAPTSSFAHDWDHWRHGRHRPYHYSYWYPDVYYYPGYYRRPSYYPYRYYGFSPYWYWDGYYR
jgi:hypothetical protein